MWNNQDLENWQQNLKLWEAATAATPATDELVKAAPLKKGGGNKRVNGLLQNLLKRAGHLTGTSGPRKDGVDGDFGGGTQAALEGFIGKPVLEPGDREILDSKIQEAGIDQAELVEDWLDWGELAGMVMRDQGALQAAYDKYFSKKTGFPQASGDLDADVASYIYFKEGGITDDPDDTDPAKNPMPFKYDTATGVLTANGEETKLEGLVPKQTKSRVTGGTASNKWHTNRGITWATWSGSEQGTPLEKAKRWLTVDKARVAKKYYDKYFTPAIAEAGGSTGSRLADHWFGMVKWGSGNVKSYLPHLARELEAAGIQQTGSAGVKEAIQKLGEQEALSLMIKARINQFEAIGQNSPAKQKYVKGWSNSAMNFHNSFVNHYAAKQEGSGV
jgi:hypothetical protein